MWYAGVSLRGSAFRYGSMKSVKGKGFRSWKPVAAFVPAHFFKNGQQVKLLNIFEARERIFPFQEISKENGQKIDVVLKCF